MSDCDRMVIDENATGDSGDPGTAAGPAHNTASPAHFNSSSSPRKGGLLDSPSKSTRSKLGKLTSNKTGMSENATRSPLAATRPARLSRRKASVPVKQGITDSECSLDSEDEGFVSQKSAASVESETSDRKSVDLNESTDQQVEKVGQNTNKEQNGQKDGEKKSLPSEKTMVKALGDKSDKGPGSLVKEVLSSQGLEGSSRPAEVPESPSRQLPASERGLVNSLVAKALKFWYDDDSPSKNPGTESPRRGFLSLSPRGKGAFELLHSPTSPMNLSKHSKETFSKALLFTADSEYNKSPDAKDSPVKSSAMLTGARLRAMLEERAKMNSQNSQNSPSATKPHSVVLPIDEKEHSSLANFASQMPGWIPVSSLGNLDIASLQQQNGGNMLQQQHSLNRKCYSCRECGKTFVHSTNLTRHMRNTHGQMPRRQRQLQVPTEAEVG